jgi:O-antigen/teichoic acid export membrane protein
VGQHRTEPLRIMQASGRGAPERSVTTRTSLLVAGRAAAAGLQAVTFVVTARLAGPERFGLIVAIVGVFTFAATVADLGLNSCMLRTIAAGPQGPPVHRMITMKMIVSIATAASLGILLVSSPMAMLRLGDYVAAVLFACWALLEMVTETAFALDVGTRKEGRAATTLLLRRAVPALTVGLLAQVMSIERAFGMSLVLGGIVAVTFNVRPVTSLLRRPSSSSVGLGQILDVARPFWFSAFGAQLQQLGPALVGVVAGSAAAGAYGVGNRLTTPLLIIPTSLSNVALVNAARDRTSSRRHRRQIYRLVGTLALACAVAFLGVGVAARPLLEILLGSSFLGAVTPLRIFLMVLILACIEQPLAGMLQGEGRERAVGRLLLLFSGSGLAFVCVGARLGGAAGAVCGLLTTHVLILVALIRMLRAEPAAGCVARPDTAHGHTRSHPDDSGRIPDDGRSGLDVM